MPASARRRFGEDGIALWISWKRVNEVLRGRILADIVARSSLTEPEFTVLVHLHDAGGISRQSALAAAAGWDRTRLSHQLNRMESRGYLIRERIRNGVEVTMLRAGEEAFLATHVPLAAAVRQHFIDKLTSQQQDTLRNIIDALID